MTNIRDPETAALAESLRLRIASRRDRFVAGTLPDMVALAALIAARGRK